MSFQILNGSVFDVLPTLPAESVHCCITSPPYWGLRDYGVSGQLGLERTPDGYVSHMVDVFREVRRVLRDDGTLWLNLGDSYAANGISGPQGKTGDRANRTFTARTQPKMALGLKSKDLVGIPWRVALALQADGWYLRSDIIWSKPNPMPESVTDRPTKAHEYIFLMSKSEKYYYDANAISEAALSPARKREKLNGESAVDTKSRGFGSHCGTYADGRNKRTVWTLATLPTPDAHFATFPIELPETCLKAGCPEGGTVLDPFAGSGTTGLAAIKNGREFIGVELNPEYITIAHRRLNRHYPLLAGGAA